MTTGFLSIGSPPPQPGETPQRAAWQQNAVTIANRTQQGKLNCTSSVTLTANAATTTLNDPRIGAESVILFMATTANAQAIAVPYVTARGTGTCTLNHANNANADKSFDYIVIG